MLAAAIIVLFALSGCGASSSPAGEIKGVVHQWQLAVAERNVAEACSLLDERGQSMIKRELAGFVAAHATVSSCPGLIGFLHDAVMTPAQRTAFRTERSREVSVTGGTAKVRVTDGSIYWLTKTNGGWRISEVPLATG
jgi:hypothetical protein